MFDIIKITVVNLDSWIIFKDLLGFLSVLRVKIDADDFGIIGLKFVNYFFQRSSSAASDIEKVSFQHGHVLHHLDVSGDS